MKIILLGILIVVGNQAMAQTGHTGQYDLLIQFQSHCCGVPDQAPLDQALKTFKKAQKIKTLKAHRIGPLGREGEYAIGFPGGSLKKEKLEALIKLAKEIVPTLQDKGAASMELNKVFLPGDLPARATVEKVKW